MSALINFDNVPGRMISGLNDEELEWVSKESETRFLNELLPNPDIDAFLSELNFSDIDADITIQMDQLEAESIPKTTQYSTDYNVKKLKAFLVSNNLSSDIESMPAMILAQYLRLFYFNLKCKDGSPYSPRTLIGIRAAIQRYLTNPVVNRKINIMNDPEFTRANGLLKAMVGKWLKDGKKGQHFAAIEPEDLTKIRNHFDRQNPVSLQQEVWFNLVFFLGLRGREILCSLKKSAVYIQTDSESRRYCCINEEYLSKNVKASLSQKEFENLKTARMYEYPIEKENCPVEALLLYFSKMPENVESLFPLPIKIDTKKKIWYSEKRQLGKDALGKMMKNISESAKTSKIYTNHCVRVTVVSELAEKGFSSMEIASVTGHKSVESVSRYVRKQRDSEKHKISAALLDSYHLPEVPNKIQNIDNKVINFVPKSKFGESVSFVIQNNTNCTFNIYHDIPTTSEND
jgi:integrase